MVESMGLDVRLHHQRRPPRPTRADRSRRLQGDRQLAHDEYYSVPIRRALEAARDRGVNLMFLGRQRRVPPHPPRALGARPPPPGGELPGGQGGSALRHERRPGAGDHRVAGRAQGRPRGRAGGELLRVEPVQGRHGGGRPRLVDPRRDRAGRRCHKFKDLVQNEYDRVTPEVAGTPNDIEVHLPLAARVPGQGQLRRRDLLHRYLRRRGVRHRNAVVGAPARPGLRRPRQGPRRSPATSAR